MRSVEQFAQGIVDVVEGTMERAIRVISVERGRDPRDYALVAFGGAGGLHACNLAASLSMRRVMIPKFPGALSALGIFCADAVKDFSRTVLLAVESSGASGSHARKRKAFGELEAKLTRAFGVLDQDGLRAMREEGFAAGQVRSERYLDMRYVGQAYELGVPATGDFLGAFHREHARRYGYSDAGRPVEIVNVRARFIGASPRVHWTRQRLGKGDCRAAIIGTRAVYFHGRRHVAHVYQREKLRPGNRFRGPAIVAEYSATTVVPGGWRASVDGLENLLLVGEADRRLATAKEEAGPSPIRAGRVWSQDDN